MAAAGDTGKRGKVGIVGSGLIGRGWAMLFAAADFNVYLYDLLPEQTKDALVSIKVQLRDLESSEMLRGNLKWDQQLARITTTSDLKECIKDTVYVQECVPEQLSLKREVFQQLDGLVGDETVLGSSTSSMPCSKFTSEMKHRTQCIVSHPVNPPFYCPLVEVVPAPYTSQWVTARTMEYMRLIGQEPVQLNKELPGFALNRVQYACLNECWSLVKSGAISTEDIDKVMKHGLGLRFAFMGPMETIHLNAQGLVNYCERYGNMIYEISQDLSPPPKLGGEDAKRIEQDLATKIPLDKLEERWRWRDQRLAALAKLKKTMGE